MPGKRKVPAQAQSRALQPVFAATFLLSIPLGTGPPPILPFPRRIGNASSGNASSSTSSVGTTTTTTTTIPYSLPLVVNGSTNNPLQTSAAAAAAAAAAGTGLVVQADTSHRPAAGPPPPTADDTVHNKDTEAEAAISTVRVGPTTTINNLPTKDNITPPTIEQQQQQKRQKQKQNQQNEGDGGGGDYLIARVPGEKYKHVTSHGSRFTAAFTDALKKGRVIDGRILFSAKRGYPSAITSILRYDPRAENEAMRARQQIGKRLFKDPLAVIENGVYPYGITNTPNSTTTTNNNAESTTSNNNNSLLTGQQQQQLQQLQQRGGGGGGGGAHGGVASLLLTSNFVRWKEVSHEKLLRPEFPHAATGGYFFYSDISTRFGGTSNNNNNSSSGSGNAQMTATVTISNNANDHDNETARNSSNTGKNENNGSGGDIGASGGVNGDGGGGGGSGASGALGSGNINDGNTTLLSDGSLLLEPGPGNLMSYDPNALEDPAAEAGAGRVRYEKDGFIMSLLSFKPRQVSEDESNERFARAQPYLNFGDGQSLTLSKIRSLKAKALDVWWSNQWELGTVALAIVSLERLIVKRLVTKGNRKIAMATCLLLAFKMNEAREGGHTSVVTTTSSVSSSSSSFGVGNTNASSSNAGNNTMNDIDNDEGEDTLGPMMMMMSGTSSSMMHNNNTLSTGAVAAVSSSSNISGNSTITPTTATTTTTNTINIPAPTAKEVLDALEIGFGVTRREVIAAEFPIFSHLGFALDVPAHMVAPHFSRMLEVKGVSLVSYLGLSGYRRHALLSAPNAAAVRAVARQFEESLTREDRMLIKGVVVVGGGGGGGGKKKKHPRKERKG